ncbi:ANKRD17, partial [Symbiodinium pilosum]
LSLALATFSQGLKRRREVLQSPEAYNGWLQELIGRLEAHLAELSESRALARGANNDGGQGTEGDDALVADMAAPSEAELLEAAGYTVVHEALGGSRPPRAVEATTLTQARARGLANIDFLESLSLRWVPGHFRSLRP